MHLNSHGACGSHSSVHKSLLFEDPMKLRINFTPVFIACLALLSSCTDRNTAKTYLNHALYYYGEQNFSKATECVKNSLNFDSSNPEAQALLGRLLFMTEEFDQAQIQFEKACRLETGNLDYKWWLVKTYILNGSEEKAKNLISDLQKKDSLDWRLFYWKAQLAKQEMDFETYFECLNNAALLLKEGVAVYEELAVIWHKLNVADKTALYFGKAEVLKK